MAVVDVPVLIVGGGMCGLSSSVFLSDLGIDHLLVERHSGTSHVPKAHYLNQRSMEIFRQHGVADTVVRYAAAVHEFGKVRWQTSLAGSGPLDGQVVYEMDAFGGGALRETYERHGPILPSNIPQLRLEPLLRGCAEQRAAGRVRYGHELLEFSDDGDRVTALVVDRRTGDRLDVRAQYLIGADGGKTIGEALGVRLDGPTGLAGVATAHFTADLSAWIKDGTMVTWLIRPERGDLLRAALVAMGPSWGPGSEEWGLHLTFAPDSPARFDAASVVPRIREVLGLPELRLRLHHVSQWILEAVLADRYRVGRVFLAGDAVHRHPPATGLGMNTAIQDAHNLAWKLAAVLSGRAGVGLLDSYELERRPIGRQNVDWATSTSLHHQVITEAALGLGPHLPPEMYPAMFFGYFADSPMGETARARASEIFQTNRAECQAHGIELGFRYEHGALVPDGTSAPVREPMGDRYCPTTRPGHRLPHCWITEAGRRASTHDLTEGGTSFALLTGPDGDQWSAAAERVAARFGVPIHTARIGAGGDWADPDGTWARVREVAPDGAVLVRPDNHVGWRSHRTPGAPTEALSAAMRTLLHR